MTDHKNIRIGKKVEIAGGELLFKYSRSSGPGGQNVNKLNTKVTVVFNIEASESLTDRQKKRLIKKLASRIDKNGNMRVVCQKSRSQAANKETALLRLGTILEESLKKAKVRRKTKPTLASKERQLKAKKQRSGIKQGRSKKCLDMND